MHYIRESEPGLWTVGVEISGNWHPIEDFNDLGRAQAQAHYLNGGNMPDDAPAPDDDDGDEFTVIEGEHNVNTHIALRAMWHAFEAMDDARRDEPLMARHYQRDVNMLARMAQAEAQQRAAAALERAVAVLADIANALHDDDDNNVAHIAHNMSYQLATIARNTGAIDDGAGL